MPSKDGSKSEPGADPICPPKVQVLCIPADGSEFKAPLVNTVTDDKTKWKNIDARTVELERLLGHTPDLRQFHIERRIDLNWLSLFDRDPCVPSSAASKPFKPDDFYYIYKCVTRTPAKLPINKHLDTFKGARAYGDAFIFKVLVAENSDGEDKAGFDSMDCFLKEFGKGGDAFEILALMARW